MMRMLSLIFLVWGFFLAQQQEDAAERAHHEGHPDQPVEASGPTAENWDERPADPPVLDLI